MPVANENVGVAFALVSGAGAATAVGASVVFFPTLVKLTSKRVLASALGISAGVMFYVSFVEIFNKSILSFEDGGETPERAYIFSTLWFFGGVVVMLLLNLVVKVLSGGHHHHHDKDSIDGPHMSIPQKTSDQEEVLAAPHCVGCSSDPAGDLEEWQHRAEEEELREQHKDGMTLASNNSVEKFEDNAGVNADDFKSEDAEPVIAGTVGDIINEEVQAEQENKKLIRMGINTALAIGLHNFPEGLATFVAALNDPGVGAVLAIAIGIHNIPEGLCVALPIYYATGNRWKAFLWACLSGISEPIAALLGWAVLANSFTHQTYAILFGLVAGMMVVISVRELLPTAHRYDPEDTVVTFSFIGGMAIMALSLILFLL